MLSSISTSQHTGAATRGGWGGRAVGGGWPGVSARGYRGVSTPCWIWQAALHQPPHTAAGIRNNPKLPLFYFTAQNAKNILCIYLLHSLNISFNKMNKISATQMMMKSDCASFQTDGNKPQKKENLLHLHLSDSSSSSCPSSPPPPPLPASLPRGGQHPSCVM